MTRITRVFWIIVLSTLALAGIALAFAPSPLIVLAVFAAGIGSLYPRMIVRLERFARATRIYHGGDRSARVPVTGRDEISSLQHSFNEMADELESVTREAERAAATRSEFVSTVSHELRSPLTAITGYVKMMRAGDAGPLSDTQREFLDIVITNSDRMSHLISDLLDADKIESGRIQLVRQPIDLAPILEEVRTTFAALATQKGLELTVQAPAKLGPISADRNRIVQVFVNLVSNAIKYTEKGRVSITASASEDSVVVEVRDTGVGIRPEDQSRLFQRFYRARSGLASAEPGSGLGLFLAYRLVIAHGGALDVESTPGQGTRFSVAFPMARASREARTAATSGAPVLPIWLLERDPKEAEQLKEIIARSHVRARGRALQAEVFTSLDQMPDSPDEPPALVIYDPQSQAYDSSLPAKLRRKLPARVPLLVISPSVSTAGAFAEAASALLTKPVAERELVIALRELLNAAERRVLLVSSAKEIRSRLRLELERRGVRAEDCSPATGRARLEAGGFGLLVIDDADFDAAGGLDELKLLAPVGAILSPAADPARARELATAGVSFSVGRQLGVAAIAEAVYRYLEEGET